ncbi:MAG: hypothetical protein EAX96_13980 [Candidatus Lokiarchaeota archaeon]|nr:hypothetical protein [Candidatus Lokiarchaeota archaeon]
MRDINMNWRGKISILICFLFLLSINLQQNCYGYGSTYGNVTYIYELSYLNEFLPASNDSAYYYYNKTNDQIINVELTWNTSTNLDLFLYNSNQILVANSSNPNPYSEILSFPNNSSGKFYILVNRTNGVDDLYFNITLDFYIPDRWPNPFTFEDLIVILVIVSIIITVIGIFVLIYFKKYKKN